MLRRAGQGVLAIALAFGPLLVTASPGAAMPEVAVAVTAPNAQGLRYESHSLYTLDLAAHAVHVKVTITVTNQQPSTTSGGIVRQYYFPRIGVPVLSEATNFSATRDTGASLNVSPEDTPSPLVKIAAIDLKPALFYPQSQSIEFDYDLPAQPPRSPGLTRINDAFSSFLAFGFGDPGITSVHIVLPASLSAEVVGVDMRREVHGDQATFVADSIDDPDVWTAAVSASNDAQLVEKEATVDGQRIVVKGWPDDQQWVEFVDGQLKKGLPELEQLIGQRWPDTTKDLTVTETAAPYLYGYAGWYDQTKNSIEIGDGLDAIVVLHEISHTWFNNDLFAERWVNEAFANEFASRAIEKVGESLQSPGLVAPDSPSAFKLNDWGKPRLQDSDTLERERFGYDASWTILRTISTEVGLDALKKVIDAAAHKRLAYQTSTSADESSTTATSHELLDLLEEVGGSKQATMLFTQYVFTLDDASSLLARDPARASYHQFVDSSAGWGAPLAIRAAMSSWNFNQATALLPDAREILRTRDQIAETLRPLNRSVPTVLQQHYESDGDLDLRAVADEANRDLDAARHIVDASNSVHSSHGIVGTFGLLFAGADDKVSDAENALDKGDATRAISLADSARRQSKDATKAGVIRLVIVLAMIATGYALWTWGRPFARRTLEVRAAKQQAARAPTPAPWPEWATPVPPYYPPAPPPPPPPPLPHEIASPDPSSGGPPTQEQKDEG
ncbi:MAG: hypothetical protein QOD92_1591 [Acidimicrobiaceae bacterium]|jgi:hypothetical protein